MKLIIEMRTDFSISMTAEGKLPLNLAVAMTTYAHEAILAALRKSQTVEVTEPVPAEPAVPAKEPQP